MLNLGQYESEHFVFYFGCYVVDFGFMKHEYHRPVPLTSLNPVFSFACYNFLCNRLSTAHAYCNLTRIWCQTYLLFRALSTLVQNVTIPFFANYSRFLWAYFCVVFVSLLATSFKGVCICLAQAQPSLLLESILSSVSMKNRLKTIPGPNDSLSLD